MAWARASACSFRLFADVVQHLPERGQPLAAMMKEVRPTHFLGVPRIWQRIAAELSVQIENSGSLRRILFAWAEAMGLRRARRLCGATSRDERRRLEPIWRAVHRLMIFPALYKLGLAHLRGGASGGAPIPDSVTEKWQAWGLPLRNVYGSTEAGMMGSPAQHLGRPASRPGAGLSAQHRGRRPTARCWSRERACSAGIGVTRRPPPSPSTLRAG